MNRKINIGFLKASGAEPWFRTTECFVTFILNSRVTPLAIREGGVLVMSQL